MTATPFAGTCWKEDLGKARKHHDAWWRREGLVVAVNKPVPRAVSRLPAETLEPIEDIEMRFRNPQWRAREIRAIMARHDYPLDTLPLAPTMIGPGSLAMYLGSKPEFDQRTIWFHPCISDPDTHPPIVFDAGNEWWRIQVETIRALMDAGGGNYMVGCPDLVENMDILASMRGSEELLLDLVDRPDWVREKIAEINRAYVEVYELIHDMIRSSDGWAAFNAFGLWGRGKTLKLQCDISAMFSPAMFNEFVLPALAEQCAYADCTMYHLDGEQALCHLDTLLSIEDLDAIEWTPVHHDGYDPKWYPLYRKILDAGKSVQVIDLTIDTLAPLLDAIGPKGVYARINGVVSPDDVERLNDMVSRYR